MIQLLYADQPVIGIPELEKIIQCIALFADTVWIQNGVHVDERVEEKEQEHITNSLAEYAEAGFIKVWDYPIDRPQEQCSIWVPGGETFILPEKHYSTMRERVDGETERYSIQTEALIANAGMKNNALLDGFAELVHLRNNLWTSLIAAELKTSSVVTNRSRMERFKREIDHVSGCKGKSVNQDFFQLFAEWQNLSGFHKIPAKEMQDIRRWFSHFREFVLKHIQPGTELLERKEDIDRDFKELRGQFQQDIEGHFRRKINSDSDLLKRQLWNAPLTIASYFVGAVGLLPHIKDVIDTRRERLAIPPHIVYVMELQRRTS